MNHLPISRYEPSSGRARRRGERGAAARAGLASAPGAGAENQERGTGSGEPGEGNQERGTDAGASAHPDPGLPPGPAEPRVRAGDTGPLRTPFGPCSAPARPRPFSSPSSCSELFVCFIFFKIIFKMYLLRFFYFFPLNLFFFAPRSLDYLRDGRRLPQTRGPPQPKGKFGGLELPNPGKTPSGTPQLRPSPPPPRPVSVSGCGSGGAPVGVGEPRCVLRQVPVAGD